jgi:HPt (histidine-containing phosphotransfer) domain-containing protein
MTANVMLSELEKYKRHGMPDCLGKPFTTQELWRVLLKYFKPISSEPIDDINEYDNNEKELKMMRVNFYKNSQNVHAEIEKAAAAGDMTVAHRLAHTLKGNAGMLGKADLKNAALEVEALLRDDANTVWEKKMKALKIELTRVFEEFKELIDESAGQEIPQTMSSEQALALFEKLKPMLEKINPECIDLLDSVRAVPGTEELVRQMENYNFKGAAKTLVELKNKIGEKL